ncbi:MAG: TonB-dependent receptor, partial [Bacteroidota bacterium]
LTESLGNELLQDENGQLMALEPRRARTQYGFWLPSLHLRQRPSEKWQWRFSLGTGYARPDYFALLPTRFVDVEDETVRRGNPALAPAFAWNLDLQLEHYAGELTAFTVGLFAKHIRNFQYRSVGVVTGDEFAEAGPYRGFRLNEYRNGRAVRILGVELSVQQQLKGLPAPFNRLFVNANYTFTTSRGGTALREDVRLPGQAPHTGNLALLYQDEDFTAGISLNYNGSFVSRIGSTPAEDEIRHDRYQLDVNVTHRLGKHFRLFAEGLNLTDWPQYNFLGDPDRVTELEIYGWSVRAGVGWRF